MIKKQNFFQRIDHQSRFTPDFIAATVVDIDIATLQQLQIKAIMLDIDDTLVVRRGEKVESRVIEHLNKIHQSGIKLIIGSNTKRDITALAASVNARIISRTWWHYKPMKIFFRHIVTDIQLSPDQVVMVGDRIINDIFGANRAGLHTILVTPVGRQPGWFGRWYSKRLGRIL